MSQADRFVDDPRTETRAIPNRAARRHSGNKSARSTLGSRVVRFGLAGTAAAAGGSAALVFTGGPQSGATTPPSWANAKLGQEWTQSQAIAVGLFTRQASVQPDGSKTYTYTYANGITATEVVPPPGFHPLTASDATLLKYGFPLRPSTTTELASWTKGMADYTGMVTPNLSVQAVPSRADPIVRMADKNIGLATESEESSSSSGHGLWAGYVGHGSTYDGAWAHFSAPNLGARCTPSSPYPNGLSIWTGLGGYGTNKLIQSGIEAGETLGGGSTVWQPFWEELAGTYNTGQQGLRTSTTLMAINPGNGIWSKTTYSSTNGGHVRYYIENVTTGQTASYVVTGQSGAYTGSTVDFITEDPNLYYTNGISYIYNVAVPFSSFAWETADVFGGPSIATSSTRLSTTRVSTSGLSNVNDFSVAWNHC